MNKNLPRDSKFCKTLEYAPDYDPKFEFGKKQLLSCGAPFDTMTSRNSQVKPYVSTNEDYPNYDELYASQKSNFFPK